MNEADMRGQRIVALVRDLMFGSRVRGAAPDAVLVRAPDALLEAVGTDTTLVILELEVPGATGVISEVRERAPEARVVAFAPHVLEDALEVARSAGAEAMARGAFVKRLRELVAGAGS